MNLDEMDLRHLWHPFTRHSVHAAGLPVIERGEGIHLLDDAGNRYVDAISSWWCCALGHGHPAVVEAIRAQAGRLQHSILGGLSHPGAVKLAARIAGLLPGSQWHVHFAADGSCAVETAVKMAVQYWDNRGQPRKTRLLALREAYHGDTLATVSLGYQEAFHRPFRSLLWPVTRLPVPPYDGTEEECVAAAAGMLQEQADDAAALIVEPLCQCAAGMRIYPATYLRELSSICSRLGILLIADEIATGFCRTGRMFAFEHAGIRPDIVCLGKALTAGYLPMSAAAARDGIFDTFRDGAADHTFYHGHTFCGNPISAAAALAALDVYETEGYAEKAARAGEQMESLLGGLRSTPGVRDVRILGAVAAVEFRDSPPWEIPTARRVQQRMREKGYLLRPLGNVIYLFMPLIAAEADITAACRALAASIGQRG